MSDASQLLSIPKNNFISSYSVAHQLVKNALDSHQTYYDLIDACENHIDGKKPLDPESLKKMGMGWADNYNYGKARAKIEKGTAESISKISSAVALGYCKFRSATKEDRNDEILRFLEDPVERSNVGQMIGYAMATVFSEETRFSGFLNDVEYPSYAFGYCALLFDPYDWLPDPTHPRKIAFKPKTKADDIRVWVTFKTVEASDLYDRWIDARNQKTKMEMDESNGTKKQIASSGWNLLGLEEVLMRAFKGKIDNVQLETWETVVPHYQNDPSYFILNTESVNIAKIFYKEQDGTLSEVYIAYNNSFEKGDKTRLSQLPAINEILFQKNHGKFDQENHIVLIRDSGFSSKDGYIQQYRGIAKYSVEDSMRYDRHRNSMGNKSKFAGSPMFVANNSNSKEKLKVSISQGFTILDSPHSIVERQPSFDINSQMNMVRFEEQEFNRDTQQFDATIQGRLTSRPNNGEVQRVTQEVELADTAKNNIKLRDYSALIHSIIKRMPQVKCKKSDAGYKGRKKFYELLKQNISFAEKDEDVNKIISAIHSFIIEPIVSNRDALTMGLQMAETPQARNRLKRMMLLASGFPMEEVNLSVPLSQDKFMSYEGARVATFENNLFFMANDMAPLGTDDHIVHLDTHLNKADQVIRGAYGGSLSPVDAFKFLENSLLHASGHAEMLGQQPFMNSKAQEYMQVIANMIREKNRIQSAAEQMMQQQQQAANQPQIDPEVQNKIATKQFETEANIYRKDLIAQANNQQRIQKEQNRHEEKMEQIRTEQP